MRPLTVLFLIIAAAGSASPDSSIVSFTIVPVDDSGLLPGSVTQDLVFEVTESWLSSQLLVVPNESGEIYQHSPLGQYYPQPDWWGPFPELEYDSVVTDGDWSEPALPDVGAIDLGGGMDWTFDENLIDICWWPGEFGRIGALTVARVTLSESASGTWAFRGSASPSYIQIWQGVILDGHMIPEPGTLIFLVIGAGVLLKRRR